MQILIIVVILCLLWATGFYYTFQQYKKDTELDELERSISGEYVKFPHRAPTVYTFKEGAYHKDDPTAPGPDIVAPVEPKIALREPYPGPPSDKKVIASDSWNELEK